MKSEAWASYRAAAELPDRDEDYEPEPPACSRCHRPGLRSVRFMGMQATAYPRDYDPDGEVAAYDYIDEEIWLCRTCRRPALSGGARGRSAG